MKEPGRRHTALGQPHGCLPSAALWIQLCLQLRELCRSATSTATIEPSTATPAARRGATCKFKGSQRRPAWTMLRQTASSLPCQATSYMKSTRACLVSADIFSDRSFKAALSSSWAYDENPDISRQMKPNGNFQKNLKLTKLSSLPGYSRKDTVSYHRGLQVPVK